MKFYLVYRQNKPGHENPYRTRTFSKQDMDWFGVDEKMALQRFRTIARNCGDYCVPHIKCIDLDALPEYQVKSMQDEQINEITKKVIRALIVCTNSRAVTNQKGGVTISFTMDNIDEAKVNNYGNANCSLIHNSKANRHYVSEEAYNKVFDIILDKKMKNADIFVPVKVNINGKLFKKYRPSNEN